MHLALLLLACGAGPELDQPAPPPDWPLENLSVKPSVMPTGQPAAKADDGEPTEVDVLPESAEDAAPDAPADDAEKAAKPVPVPAPPQDPNDSPGGE